jgi:hypothetical protein
MIRAEPFWAPLKEARRCPVWIDMFVDQSFSINLGVVSMTEGTPGAQAGWDGISGLYADLY